MELQQGEEREGRGDREEGGGRGLAWRRLHQLKIVMCLTLCSKFLQCALLLKTFIFLRPLPLLLGTLHPRLLSFVDLSSYSRMQTWQPRLQGLQPVPPLRLPATVVYATTLSQTKWTPAPSLPVCVTREVCPHSVLLMMPLRSSSLYSRSTQTRRGQ